MLRHTVEKLLARYGSIVADSQRNRKRRLRQAFYKFEAVGRPAADEITPAAIASYVRALPPSHEHYADALMVAQLVIDDAGVSIRGSARLRSCRRF